MYSDTIIDRRVRSIESAYNVRLHRYPVDESIAISRHISTAYDERGKQTRALEPSEHDFILNEMALSRSDFRYWSERYVEIVVDDEEGKRANITLTGAQNVFLARMAKTEDKLWVERDRGNTRFDGQCYFVHKARQAGLSTHCELIGLHLINFYSDIAGLAGSTNDQMTQKLYTDYFLSVYDAQPPWMRGQLKSKVKDRGIDLLSGSRIVLQDASQRAGFGQGSKWHWCHLTEVASWPDPVSMVENHFFPSISRSIRAHAFLESTSQGMFDWWHQRTELARRGDFERWQYMFIPWYLVPEFYHSYPPDGWLPSRETIEQEKLIERSSPEWADGKTIHPTREMLYWWEEKRKFYQRMSTLNEFYKNYPSVPEESFVHSGQSSFEVEVLERQQRSTRAPWAYEIATSSLPSELVLDDREQRQIGAKIYTIDERYDLVPVRVPEKDQPDSRGLILMFEPPSPQHDYFGGADPAVGIANWSRHTKSKYDGKRDNSALQIVRRGFYGAPDVQVAEFAAPIFPQDFALYLYVLGRLFCGRNEEKQALMTIEVNNHGRYTQEELLHKYNYYNLYQRRTAASNDGVNLDFSERYGWLTSASSIRELWTLGKKHISDGRFEAASNWLVTEMRHCQDDDVKYKMSSLTRGKAEGGDRHDDRVYALLFALEGAHSLSYGMFTPPSPVTTSITLPSSPRRYSPAERDMTHAQYMDAISDWESSIGEL